MTGWSDVDDHGVLQLRAEWRSVPDDPPLAIGPTVDVPVDLVDIETTVPR